MSVNTTNFQKFKSKNVVVNKLIGRFYRVLYEHIAQQQPRVFLDAGCGEGESIKRLNDILASSTVYGFDINSECVAFCKNTYPQNNWQVDDIYQTSYSDNFFDMVMCCEVLEHLQEPHKALQELIRISRKYLLLSVPHEPYFQIGSFCRGKYWKNWGNHPEHINHWNSSSFCRFLRDNRKIKNIKMTNSFPWLITLCEIED